MITTIQIKEDVKSALEKLKQTRKETYEDVIVKMMNQLEEQKRAQTELLIEECREMKEESLRTAKEWEMTLMDGLDK